MQVPGFSTYVYFINNELYHTVHKLTVLNYIRKQTRCAGSDGSMSASVSARRGFDPRKGGKFLFENFQPRC